MADITGEILKKELQLKASREAWDQTTDPVAKRMLEEEMAATQAEIDRLKEAALNEKVEAEPVPYASSGLMAKLSTDGLPPELVVFIDELVMTDRKRIYKELAEKEEKLEADFNERMFHQTEGYRELAAHLETTLKEADELQEEFDQQEIEIAKLKEAVSQLSIEKADAESKRDAAVAAKEEAERDAELLRGQVAELKVELAEIREAQAYQERQAAQITPDAAETESLQAKLEAVKKLYSKTEDWGSVVKVIKPDGTFELIKRGEMAEWEAEVPSIPAPQLAVEPSSLQFQTDSISEHAMDGTLADEADIPETFEQEMRRRMDAVERVVYGKPEQEVAA